MKTQNRFSVRAWPRWVKIGVLTLVLIVLAGIVTSFYLDRLITRRLKDTVRKRSNSLYELDYQDINVNVFNRSISINKGALHADTNRVKKISGNRQFLPTIVEGNFPNIRISGIRWMKLIFSKSFVASKLYMEAPDIRLTQFKSSSGDTVDFDSSEFEEFFQNSLDGFEVRDLKIDNANLEYLYSEKEREGPTIYHFKKLNIDLRNIAINKKASDPQKKFTIGSSAFSFANYEYRTGDSLYLMGLKDLSFQSEKNLVSISQFYIQPRLTEKEYSSKLPIQKERNEISLENISLEGMEIGSILNHGEININQARIGGGHWNIYLSRVPPLPPVRKKVVPSQPLLSVSNKISIATLKVNKLQLDYREYNTVTQKTGEVRFNDISGTATNITNEQEKIEKNPHLVVALNARLMGKGDFKTRFDFRLDDTTGGFSVEAHLGEMEATHLNPAFMPLNKLEIKKGKLDEMICKGSGNQNSLRGDVALLYHDLHIAVLEKDEKLGGLKRKTFTSLVANILVKNDNPKKDEPVRTAKNVQLKRDPRKSYFNLLWMALFTGIGQIVAGK